MQNKTYYLNPDQPMTKIFNINILQKLWYIQRRVHNKKEKRIPSHITNLNNLPPQASFLSVVVPSEISILFQRN